MHAYSLQPDLVQVGWREAAPQQEEAVHIHLQADRNLSVALVDLASAAVA